MSNLYDIKTEAGKALWEKMNQNYGSSVWGQVGEGIEAIEAEVEERIIKLLQADETFPIFAYYIWNRTNAQFLIKSLTTLIKGENK